MKWPLLFAASTLLPLALGPLMAQAQETGGPGEHHAHHHAPGEECDDPEHDHEHGGGEPWMKGTVLRSVQGDTRALLCALAGAGLYRVVLLRRPRAKREAGR